MTGLAEGGPGTVEAKSAGKTGKAIVWVDEVPNNMMATGINGPSTFVDPCPTDDPTCDKIQTDFELLDDGEPTTVVISCTGSFSTIPVEQLTDELIAIQIMRVVYYMSEGTAGKLPWTPLSLCEWMTAAVSGVTFVESGNP